MPKDKPPLDKEQVALIRRWVAEGAVWPKALILKDNRRADASWWSLQPLSKVEPPSPQGIPDIWAKHPIDRFIYDLYATVLHTLGLDYKRLSYYHNGLERRLTDVHGNVIQEVLG